MTIGESASFCSVHLYELLREDKEREIYKEKLLLCALVRVASKEAALDYVQHGLLLCALVRVASAEIHNSSMGILCNVEAIRANAQLHIKSLDTNCKSVCPGMSDMLIQQCEQPTAMMSTSCSHGHGGDRPPAIFMFAQALSAHFFFAL